VLLGGMLSLAPRTGGGSAGGSSGGAAAGGGARQEELVEALANDLLDQVRAMDEVWMKLVRRVLAV
jgi:3-oxoacyl-ACP reductase-like protein